MKGDTKSTPAYSSDLHFLGTKNNCLYYPPKLEICNIGGIKNKIDSAIGLRFVKK